MIVVCAGILKRLFLAGVSKKNMANGRFPHRGTVERTESIDLEFTKPDFISFNKKSALICVTCGLMLNGVLTLCAKDSEEIEFSVPKLEGIKIDGNVADWGENGFRIDLMTPIGKPPKKSDDFSSSVRLGWNRKGLLLLVKVKDNEFKEVSKDLWQKDGVEIFLCDDKNGKDLCQWVVTPGMDKEHPEPQSHFHDMRSTGKKKNPADIELARQKLSENEYCLEMLLPWSSLGIDADKGRNIGFQIWANDCDGKEGSATYHAAFFPELSPHRDRDRMYRLKLDDDASSPFEFSVTPVYDLKNFKFILRVFALPRMTGKTVKVLKDGTLLGEATLEGDGKAFATAEISLPVLEKGQNYDKLTIKTNAAEMKASLPMAPSFFKLKSLLSRKAELIEKYRLDRPWDEMKDSPETIRRHRGMAALLVTLLDEKHKCDNGYKEKDKIDELIRLADMLEKLDNGENYLENMRNEFWSAYYSPADGSGQHFVTDIPENYDSSKQYPLIISLHGLGGRPKPNFNKKVNAEYLEAIPWGRGDTWYTGLGDHDVTQIIKYMREWYNVDPSRIYVTGASMGGRGTWVIASRHPDIFAGAAPVCGWGDELPLENLKNVPIFNQHGQKDWVVSIDQSRFAVDKLLKMGYAVAYKEFPEAGHGIRNQYPIRDWLLTLKKPEKPSSVVHSCQAPDAGKAYWASILELTDPHKTATVKATFTGFGPQQLLTLKLENIQVLSIETDSAPVDKKNDLIVQVGNEQFILNAPLPDKFFVVTGKDGKHELTDNWIAPESLVGSYTAGAAADLYTGEPLLIVYGTGGTEKRDQILEKAASRLSKHASSDWREMAFGEIPAKMDKDVTEDDIRYYNLILLGAPEENSLVKKMINKFPLRINDKNELIVDDRKALPIGDSGLRFAYYNPLAPERRIFWIASFGDDEATGKWLGDVAGLMTDSTGENRVDASDLIVQKLSGAEKRRMQFSHNWKWRKLPGADKLLPKENSSCENHTKAWLRSVLNTTDADFAFFWGENDEEQAYDPDCFTMADLRTQQRDSDIMIGNMTGEELIDIYKRWVEKNKVEVVPDYTPASIDKKKIYTVAFPPHLTWLMKDRQKNLKNVRSECLKARDFWKEIVKGKTE